MGAVKRAAVKRVQWPVVVAGVWLAWRVTKTFFWHPSFADGLADGGALVMFLLTVASAARHPQPEKLKDWRIKHQLTKLRKEFTRSEDWAARNFRKQQDELDALRAELAGLGEGIARVAGVTGRKVPSRVTADAPTQPIYLNERRRTS